ncbi:hypothetical protein L2E82_16554 [Cichorium intybus]|uniref:Uncharacterized protein n=1 Tax=Cichorium intybus TaxID=13427 RepID=A0ACB9F6C0_CICIN|nr:hypothetical protein L2E82_16554 [Cichorium intybus]
MGNLKDDAKKMDPLFPRLHISDADKGVPRTSARNNMALTQQPVLPLSTSGLVPSYHDASYKRSVFSSFGSSCGSTRLATRFDSYRSSGINLNISLTTVKQTIETTNCQTLCNTGHLKRGDYRMFKPQDLKTTNNVSIKKLEDEDDEDYLVPSLSFGNANRGKLAISSTNSHIKHENKPDTVMIKDIAKEHVPSYSDRARFSETLSTELSPSSPIKRSRVVDEPDTLHDSTIRLPLKRKNFQETTGYQDGMLMWPILGDRKADKDVHEVLPSINNGSLEINPDEVSQMIGRDQYCKARRTIIQQQRVFQSQLFELHRLIKVQKRLAESTHFSFDDRGYRPMNMPSEAIFPIDGTIRRQFQTKSDADRRYSPSLIELPQPSTINGGKQPPWCLIPPPGNQWLVPMRSPSEGLVYKPYTGPCPPPVGLMAQVYGTSLTPTSRDFINGAYPQGIGVFPNNPLYTSYGLPAITNGYCSTSIEDNMKYNNPVKTLCNTLTLEKLPTIGDVQNLQENKESDVQGSSNGGDELPLFPTTPMGQDSDRCTGEKGFDERIKVIKVVPRNPKLASESAARIFQFIQEERKQNE